MFRKVLLSLIIILRGLMLIVLFPVIIIVSIISIFILQEEVESISIDILNNEKVTNTCSINKYSYLINKHDGNIEN
ncbi:hypothetical protein DJ52_15505 [Brachyspira murdochii]|uniref:Uncharacterized protein n=2 Tax=Brachyspira murdochii TaxID=84378 RepID=A0ABX5B0J2_9SPIR|nr:hypothetical protein DJ52_15505 [Brachyspira murdochii]